MKFICDKSSLLTPRIRLFRLRPTENSGPYNNSGTPGEHFRFKFKDKNGCSFLRCYTLVSTERGRYYDFIIEDKGAGSASSVISQLLTDRKEIESVGREGEVTFDSIREKRYVLLVAGGIGITLPLALIRECFKCYGCHTFDKHVQLILSCNDLGSVPYLSELLDLNIRCNWFSLRINVTCAVRDKTSDVIRPGRIDLTTVEINFPPETVVICGSVGFAEVMKSAVRQRFPQASVAVEAFSSTPVTVVKITGQAPRRKHDGKKSEP